MDSTGFDSDLLIGAIKNRPVIWNTWRNALKVVCSLMCSCFEEKAETEQNDLGTKLIKKWKGMRDTFLKSKKKKTVQGASNRTCIFARQMEFVLHCGISSATTASIDEDTETQIGEDADDPMEEINVGASVEPSAGSSSRHRPSHSATPDATAAKNITSKRTHTASEFSKIPAAKRRVIVEENSLKFMNSSPAGTPVQPTHDKSFFESLQPIVRTLPIDTKLEFRCSVMNKLKEVRTSVYSAQNIPFTTVLTPIQQHDTLVPPQKTHAPTHTPANLSQPLSVSSLNQQTMHNPPQMLQQLYSYTNLSSVSQESQMGQSYPWVPSPSNSISQHSSYTTPNDRNMIE